MVDKMTGKQRLWAAIKGEPVDRAPIWLREGFPVTEPLAPADDFESGWQQEQVYRDLHRDVIPYVDDIRSWGLGGWSNRFLMVPPDKIHSTTTLVSPSLKRIEGYIDTPRGKLTLVNEVRRGHDTAWQIKPLIETVEELKMLAEVPFDLPAGAVDPCFSQYERALEGVGDRGIVRTGLSSPMVSISHCMHLETFLEWSVTYRDLFKEILQEITQRNLALIDAVFKNRRLETIVNFGGSEQCTPPLMSPHSYDDLVVPYDGQMVARLKQYGIMVSCHCHGKIRHALQCMIDIGQVATDPVEPPPAGDVTYAEARAIADGKITLIGNLEFDELCFAEPAHIRARVREILSHGTDRLILSSSAGPISAVTPECAKNYRALVETALEFGA
jgi:uroporphyrinogen-III decarboxylase